MIKLTQCRCREIIATGSSVQKPLPISDSFQLMISLKVRKAMSSLLRKYFLPAISMLTIVISMASLGYGEVIVFDRVTTVKTPIRIKVLTKRRFFAAGGSLVDIYLDDQHLKKILTGGDGYGYLKVTPQNAGYKKVTARTDSDSASGLILVMQKREKAIIIEIEEGFKDSIFSDEIKKDSRDAVSSIRKNFQIIYLSRFMGKTITSSWLEKQDFPKSVVLRWQGPSTLAALKAKGVQLHAIIGSSAVIAEAAKHIEKRYTFEKTSNGKTVKNWEEILTLLQENQPESR